jgi:hypothetical protein
MASPDAGFVILMDEHMIACPREDSPEAVADGLNTLTGFAAYFDGVVHSRLPGFIYNLFGACGIVKAGLVALHSLHTGR